MEGNAQEVGTIYPCTIIGRQGGGVIDPIRFVPWSTCMLVWLLSSIIYFFWYEHLLYEKQSRFLKHFHMSYHMYYRPFSCQYSVPIYSLIYQTH